MKKPGILLLGSNASITNLPVKEVSLLAQGSLPAYGYNPGDFIELLAGKVTIEDGRLDQCLTWLSMFLTSTNICPKITTLNYGDRQDIFQIFRKKDKNAQLDGHGWYMVHQILPPGGRSSQPATITLDLENKPCVAENKAIMVIDDSGYPPDAAQRLREINPDAVAIGLGITIANWQAWAEEFKSGFYLICRLSDLETTRMEMDTSMVWETTVAMAIRALKSEEVGLWDKDREQFKCHVIVEMFPNGILYVGPECCMFRHFPGTLPHKGSFRRLGSVPCHDTIVPAMLAVDMMAFSSNAMSKGYFFDFSKRVILNWQELHKKGYYFTDSLEFPNLDFSSTYPTGTPCSFRNTAIDPCFFYFPSPGKEFDRNLAVIAAQTWSPERKTAMRAFFSETYPVQACESEAFETIKHLGYVGIILTVLKQLKDEVHQKDGFKDLRMFQVGALRTTDPVEIEPVVTLQGVLDSYVSKETYKRPLCIGVFGQPGSGKSFAVEQVAQVISKKFSQNPFEFLQFNLTQFAGPEEINGAIDLVRASVAKGKIPITFWDEFDCRYDNNDFGYLRYFLPSMQDGVTYVHGTPRHIGKAIFVFAGGVKNSWEDMEALLAQTDSSAQMQVKALKIPDFMSRLRVVLDIEGIEIPENYLRDSLLNHETEDLRRILLKRAFIIAHQMNSHWKSAARKTSGLLLRLLLAKYKFGARSMEAVIEASQAADRLVYGLPELIAPPAARIHAEWRVELERRIDYIRKNLGFRGVW